MEGHTTDYDSTSPAIPDADDQIHTERWAVYHVDDEIHAQGEAIHHVDETVVQPRLKYK
ncbi:hypothetical protein CASFOL_020061 [Castilleja foliolosa]|uniref:Uncharacterized protein n=1 Tax=Castilleja foliolosa TaxID=1961234 RepID=A0ABD3D2K3_9LAMI